MERLSKIGRGDRSEKLEHTDYPQNRVTDHHYRLPFNNLISNGRQT